MVHDDLDPWLGWLKLAVFSVVCWGKPCWIVCESCLIFLTSCHHSAGLKSDIPQIFFTCTHTPVTTYKAFHNSNSKFVYSVPSRERSMLMSVSVPLLVCLCQWAYLWVSTSNVHWIFCACYLWLGSILFWWHTGVQYVVHFSFMDNVISAHNGQEQRKKWCEKGLYPQSNSTEGSWIDSVSLRQMLELTQHGAALHRGFRVWYLWLACQKIVAIYRLLNLLWKWYQWLFHCCTVFL